MPFTVPVWLQGGVYAARIDRQLTQRAFGSREIVFDGFVGSQLGTPAPSLQLTAGSCVIQGDDQTDQGMYLVVLDAVMTQAFPAVPGTDKRVDLLSIRVNDPNALGPAGNNATVVITQGVVSATPVAPAAPTTAIPILTVLRTSTDSAILNAQITDVAGRGVWPYTVSAAAVPVRLPPNYLYVRI